MKRTIKEPLIKISAAKKAAIRKAVKMVAEERRAKGSASPKAQAHG